MALSMAQHLHVSASSEQCHKACRKVLNSAENRQALADACVKHNITPRPTTYDICANTYAAHQTSVCLHACDGETKVEEDVCAGVASATWISKHNAYRSCKAGFKGALSKVPKLFEHALEHVRADALR